MAVRWWRLKGLRANPFVVLADVTIALCFIFSVYAVSSTALNSQAVLFYDRDVRQRGLEKELADLVRKHFGDYPVRSVFNPKFPRDYLEIGPKGRPVAHVWTNGSFQRLSLYEPVFAKGGTKLSARGRRFFADFARIASQRAKDTSYLFVHGIVEPEEVPASQRNDPGRSWAFQKSIERSREVYQLLQTSGAIGSYRGSQAANPPTPIPAKFAIANRTGDTHNTTAGRSVGRVDLVMFIGDVSEESQREMLELQSDGIRPQ
jgi:hypothetical protein